MTGEQASVLLLMPAAVLVVLVLGAIAVDGAIAFLGEREVADIAAAAANDAAVLALREETFHRCGSLQLDPGRAGQVARTVVAGRGSDAVQVDDVEVSVAASGASPAVSVTIRGHVDLVFTPALPGAAGTRRVEARSVVIAAPLGNGADSGAGDTC